MNVYIYSPAHEDLYIMSRRGRGRCCILLFNVYFTQWKDCFPKSRSASGKLIFTVFWVNTVKNPNLVRLWQFYFILIFIDDSHLLRNRLVIDITVLCDFMDYLCGEIVVAVTKRVKKSLDGLTLPKSWLVRILRDTHGPEVGLETRNTPSYNECVGALLEALYTGNDAAGEQFNIICDSGRHSTVTYHAGHLIVGNFALSEPSMIRHRIVYFMRVWVLFRCSKLTREIEQTLTITWIDAIT